MRLLRSQLIQRFKNTEPDMAWSSRLLAVLLQQSLAVLQQQETVSFRHRRLSHQQFHRHVIVIRCPDQAFYLDALRRYFACHAMQPIALQTMVMAMHCDDAGCSLSIQPPKYMSEHNLMLIAIHLSAAVVEDIQRCLQDFAAILQAVHLSVGDFPKMQSHLARLQPHLKASNPQDAALLRWMCDDQYLLMAVSYHDECLGLLQNPEMFQHIAPGLLEDIACLAAAKRPGLSWIHLQSAQTHLYSLWGYEVVRIAWLEDTKLHQLTLLGRFSRKARYVNAHRLPRLEDVWQHIYRHPVLRLSAFYLREICILFDRLPKPFLLSVDTNALFVSLEETVRTTNAGVLHLSLFQAQCGNVWFIFLSFESDRYGPNVLASMMRCAEKQGVSVHSHHDYAIESKYIVLIHCSGEIPAHAVLHAAMQDCIYFWRDRVRDLIMTQSRHLDVPTRLQQLSHMPLLYQQFFEPAQFLNDMRYCEALHAQQQVQVQFIYQRQLECHLFSYQPLLLGELVLYVQGLGLQAQQEAVVDFVHQGKTVYLSSIRVDAATHTLQEDDYPRLAEALQYVMNESADHDMLNALVLTAALPIQHVAVLICLRNHLIQLVDSAAPMFLSQVMLAYPQASAALYALFVAKHQADTHVLDQAKKHFEQQLLSIGKLVEDRWFRALAELVLAGVRTNAFVRDLSEPIAIKVMTAQLSFAPQPKPYREIFVHGVHMEAVHLRGAKVARGGIRYSDRPADFRTEVLELMATQVLKNGVIVPTGAKGGFVVRGADTSPEFVHEQYCVFMRALLGLTDVSPTLHQCVRAIYIPEEDQHDAYLVVAADKGTASFSDSANREALQEGFWLGDAFASGGSHGYDHKAYGITARGAWVCALHLCRLLKLDVHQPLRVVAIGDMGGDVFGNGMLCQSPLQLLAAFNHQHIFLDPEPNVVVAEQERRRLFAQRGGWEKYQQDKISAGGGVFLRSAKAIKLSTQVQAMLGIDVAVLSGESLIQAILCANVDVLFNGGIGTYVKSSQQSHASVHDPVNNSVRVNASDLRCALVCEGGNLGFSQHARLEYSQAGGLISSDAIDNSAGVDMSDHEVNIKILIDHAQLGEEQRDHLLNRLGEDVVQLCLQDNQEQAQLLSLAELAIQEDVMVFQRLRSRLLQERRLDMRVDACISADDQLLLRPQLAVLMGHEKNRVYQALCQEDFDAPRCFSTDLLQCYFPAYLQQEYTEQMHKHALAREIVATQAMNQVLNHCGLCSVHELQVFTSCQVHEAVWSLLLARQLLQMTVLQQAIWQQVEDIALALKLQRQCQQWVLMFARHLLSFPLVATLCSQRLQQQYELLKSAEHPMSTPSVVLSSLLNQAEHAGLGVDFLQQMRCLPQGIQGAAAIYLSLAQKLPLQACLKMNQLALQQLPFITLEKALLSEAWSDVDAHVLRCEWLKRLSVLRAQAVQQLLDHTEETLSLWQSHVRWEAIQAIAEEPMPMQTLLMLGYLDQILQG